MLLGGCFFCFVLVGGVWVFIVVFLEFFFFLRRRCVLFLFLFGLVCVFFTSRVRCILRNQGSSCDSFFFSGRLKATDTELI